MPQVKWVGWYDKCRVKGRDWPVRLHTWGAGEQSVFIGRYFSASACLRIEDWLNRDTLTHLLVEICAHISTYCNNAVTLARLCVHFMRAQPQNETFMWSCDHGRSQRLSAAEKSNCLLKRCAFLSDCTAFTQCTSITWHTFIAHNDQSIKCDS